MADIHINKLGPDYDAVDGKETHWPDGKVWVNSDDSVHEVRSGKWHMVQGPAGLDRDIGPAFVPVAEIPALAKAEWRCVVGTIGDRTFALPPVVKIEYVAAPTTGSGTMTDRPTAWHESSTCLGVLRALTEAAAQHPDAVHDLGGPLERCNVALRDFHKALGTVAQQGWRQEWSLDDAYLELANECVNALEAKMPFASVMHQCSDALLALAEALAALDKVGAK